MNRKTRLLPLLMAALLAFALLCSVLFMAVEAHHDCTGQDCPVCQQLSACGHMLKTAAVSACAAVFAAALPLLVCMIFSVRTAPVQADTLVTRKIKLSD